MRRVLPLIILAFCVSVLPFSNAQECATLELQSSGESALGLLYEAVSTEKKRAKAQWNFCFNKSDPLLDASVDFVDMKDEAAIYHRYSRMLHRPFLDDRHVSESLQKVRAVGAQMDQIVPYLEHQLGALAPNGATIQSISIYGSFLYNIAIPDDIDFLVVVDSPVSLFEHVDVWLEEITGVPDPHKLPILSFQIVDSGTYEETKELLIAADSYLHLERNNKLAGQHLAMAARWYFTVYGRDFRYDSPRASTEKVRENYLNKAFDVLRAAGSRLFMFAYDDLQPETDQVRLRKVVSRILVTHFILHELDPSIEASSTAYRRLYEAIRKTPDDDLQTWDELQRELEKMYFKRMWSLLRLAEEYGHIDDIALYGATSN